MSRTPLVIGNWKMHGLLQDAEVRAKGIACALPESVDVALAPPFTLLATVRACLAESTAVLAAQDCHAVDQGAYTGNVSSEMLADLGVKYVLVGHSERRAMHAESSEDVAQKFIAAQRAGLLPVLCIGETLAQREQGHTNAVVIEQLNAVLALAGIDAFSSAVVAYEPVWAIGTGKTASPEQAQQVHAVLRNTLAGHSQEISEGVQLLYGGSVKPDNAAELFAQPDIDGGLIGGASLDVQSFVDICCAANAANMGL